MWPHKCVSMGSGDTSPEKTYRIDLTHFGPADCLVGRGTMRTTLAPAPATLSPVVTQTEIWTVDELAAFLKCSRRSVYELTRKRGQLGHEIPLPGLSVVAVSR